MHQPTTLMTCKPSSTSKTPPISCSQPSSVSRVERPAAIQRSLTRSGTCSSGYRPHGGIVDMTHASETGTQHVGTFWMLELDRPLPPAIVPRVPAAFMRTGPEVAGELAQAMGLDDPGIVLQRFATGRHCYAARVDGKL